jgi:predicted transcriptional regulator
VLALGDLWESLGVTQTELAGVLGVSQPNVSKLEGKDDIRLSTLGSYVAALGGRLEVRVVFPDHPEHNVSVALPGEAASGRG